MWFPRFATDRLGGARDDAGPAPRATVVQIKGGWRLAAVDRAAAQAGLTPGMPLADARAQVPTLATVPTDPSADAKTLERLAHWLGRYSPWTAVDSSLPAEANIPGAGLWLDITGCAHLFGGEDALLSDLCHRLDAAGYTVRAGLAATLGTAWALARFATDGGRHYQRLESGGERDALAGLPVTALRLPADTAENLARLGLRRIEDLYPLPRAALVLRFGLEPCLRLDQALGDRDEPLSPLAPPPLFQVRLNFPDPIGRTEDITLALDRLLKALMERLERAGKGARRLDFSLFRVDGTSDRVHVGTSRATRDAGHLLRLFEGKLDRLDAGFGIETALLAARAVDPLAADQGHLDGRSTDCGGPDNGLDRLIDRLTNRLGADRVVGLYPRASHLPEHAETPGPPGRRIPKSPDLKEPTALRPLYLLPHPEPVDVLTPTSLEAPTAFRWRRRQHRIVIADGPERIAPEWWRDMVPDGDDGWIDGDTGARDYYRVEDDAGERFWLYRAGRPLPGQAPKWFLHGLFP